MSTSNVVFANGPAVRSVDDAILDAARSCVEEFGVKRTTLAEVARRAGVSRPTVYRRWPDTRTLIGELLTRELRRSIPTASTEGDARDRAVRGVVAGARAIRTNPLFEKIFRTDADLISVYILERLGRSQINLLRVFEAAIASGQADGSIRSGNPAELAATVLLIAQSMVQSARIVSAALSPDALDTELGIAIDGYLTPRKGST